MCPQGVIPTQRRLISSVRAATSLECELEDDMEQDVEQSEDQLPPRADEQESS